MILRKNFGIAFNFNYRGCKIVLKNWINTDNCHIFGNQIRVWQKKVLLGLKLFLRKKNCIASKNLKLRTILLRANQTENPIKGKLFFYFLFVFFFLRHQEREKNTESSRAKSSFNWLCFCASFASKQTFVRVTDPVVNWYN